MAEAFGTFRDRYTRFFRTKTRDSAPIAGRHLQGPTQAEDCTFAEIADVVENGFAQQFQHFITNSPWQHEPVIAQIGAEGPQA